MRVAASLQATSPITLRKLNRTQRPWRRHSAVSTPTSSHSSQRSTACSTNPTPSGVSAHAAKFAEFIAQLRLREWLLKVTSVTVARMAGTAAIGQNHRHACRPQARDQGGHRRVLGYRHPVPQRDDDRIVHRRVVERGMAGVAAHHHGSGRVRQRVLRGEIVRRIRIAHHRGKAIGRDVDVRDLIGARTQFRQRLLQAIERRVDRIAARV